MENNKLFAEFPEVSTKEWEDVIIKDLKGADYEKKLVWKTLEGFDVKPYYRAEDLATLEYLNGNPAEAPFVRGYKKTTNAWDVRQDVRECDIATANAIALAGLKRGVTYLGLVAKNVKTAAEDWKEIATDTFMFARYAKEDFDSDDWERKRTVIKTLGAHLQLSGRTIVFTPVKYLAPIAENRAELEAKKEAARTAPEQIKKDLREDLISVWCT
jgi:hypothetical protein